MGLLVNDSLKVTTKFSLLKKFKSALKTTFTKKKKRPVTETEIYSAGSECIFNSLQVENKETDECACAEYKKSIDEAFDFSSQSFTNNVSENCSVLNGDETINPETLNLLSIRDLVRIFGTFEQRQVYILLQNVSPFSGIRCREDPHPNFKRWIRTFESILDLAALDDELKLKLLSIKLSDVAAESYDDYVLSRAGSQISYTEVKEHLTYRFHGTELRETFVKKFYCCTRSKGENVLDYAHRLSQILKNAYPISQSQRSAEMLAFMDQFRKDQFIAGLSLKLRQRVQGKTYLTFDDLVKATLRIEALLEEKDELKKSTILFCKKCKGIDHSAKRCRTYPRNKEIPGPDRLHSKNSEMVQGKKLNLENKCPQNTVKKSKTDLVSTERINIANVKKKKCNRTRSKFQLPHNNIQRKKYCLEHVAPPLKKGLQPKELLSKKEKTSQRKVNAKKGLRNCDRKPRSYAQNLQSAGSNYEPKILKTSLCEPNKPICKRSKSKRNIEQIDASPNCPIKKELKSPLYPVTHSVKCTCAAAKFLSKTYTNPLVRQRDAIARFPSCQIWDPGVIQKCPFY